MLIHSASQLLTLTKDPQRGHELGQLNIIDDGAVRIADGEISAVGSSQELMAAYPDDELVDAQGRVVIPGFVDPHTHVIWAGDRAKEFEQRLEGKTYLEILAEGGGILSTVKNTRAAKSEELINATRSRLQAMFAHGTTTVEAKTGYGLDTQVELKLLHALVTLAQEGPWDLAFTFLGAHAIPAEYAGRTDEYTKLVCQTMLPDVKKWWQTNCADMPLPFVDVFCETGAFNLEQTRKILEVGRQLGFPLKLHADEFDNLGGTSLGVELGATSIDHLVAASDEDIRRLAESSTVAV
ncbi:MAG: imidazolonepropionase, partial [Chloroflexota bacterium]